MSEVIYLFICFHLYMLQSGVRMYRISAARRR